MTGLMAQIDPSSAVSIDREGEGGLVVQDLVVEYGRTQALHGVSFAAPPGSFVTLLGPSGSGKTTLLRALAGLVTPSGGRITITRRQLFDAGAGVDIPIQKRNIGMVFQSFALWPHKTVAANIAYPLELRKVDRRMIAERVGELLELTQLQGLGERYPAQLSGGQQQRVSLARSIAYQPALLLMDEPLSSLDTQLRDSMRSYIRRFQREVGITTVYVTHDRHEALALSDVVVLLQQGRIVEIGSPEQMYARPKSAFTANFLSGANVLEAADLGPWTDRVATALRATSRGGGGEDWGPASVLAIRPEEVSVRPVGAPREDEVTALVLNSEFLGDRWRVELQIKGTDTTLYATMTQPLATPVLPAEAPPEVLISLSASQVLQR